MIRLIALLILTALPASAQTWSSIGTDDGEWFIGAATSPGYEFIFQCGGRSPANLPLSNDATSGPKTTDPDQIMLSMDPRLFTPTPDTLTGAAIVVDGTPFPIAPLSYNEMDQFFEVPLNINDPLFARLRAGTSAGITWNGTWVARNLPLAGSSEAIRVMAQTCVAGWAGQMRGPTIWDSRTVLDTAAGFCNGPAKVDMNYVTIQDLDGDDIQDLLLDIGAVTCTEQEGLSARGAGMCGASHCSQFVYLSRNGNVEPDEFLAIGSRVVTDAQGQITIHGGAGLAVCQAQGFEYCESQFAIRSGRLNYIGLVPFETSP